MKKVFCLFFTAVLLVCFLCGCSVLPGEKTSYPDENQVSDGSSPKEPNNTNAEDPALTALQQKINHHSKGPASLLSAMWTAKAPRSICAPIMQAAKRERPIPT